MTAAPDHDWKSAAKAEIASIKKHFARKHKWQISCEEDGDHFHLYVVFRHENRPGHKRALRLTYSAGFPAERPREAFVNPENYAQEGPEYWIDDLQKAFKSQHQPPVICLEGTWGFHHKLHQDRPVEKAVLTKLLLEIQTCFDRTP